MVQPARLEGKRSHSLLRSPLSTMPPTHRRKPAIGRPVTGPVPAPAPVAPPNNLF